MTITVDFHNAIILSIIHIINNMKHKGYSINIFKFIQMLIYQTNWLLSPGESIFEIILPKDSINKLLYIL